ncbi:Flp pilus assembly protein CpaB [Sneathiella limimaris]|uniref:Flp pilus assembly protein CpaB n=1 Tax=Sneathiella limimaris TaxID=1964213 RepID=UPI00146F03F1|nr:Flp pilus assembly protein CpaB [Sneathiella limimaris]
MARKLILVVFALVIAGATVMFVRNWAGNQTSTPVVQTVTETVVAPKEPEKKILVAANDLPAGTLVREEHLTWQEWPDSDGLEEKYIVENVRTANEFFGTVVRKGIAVGEPISESRMVRPGQQGFLAAVLEPGMRAVSINVDATAGIAGFVFPGDKVDVVLTLTVNREGESQIPQHASETILTDVRVVAMDQTTDDQTQQATVRSIATLEVTPKQVEVVSVARELGRLSLSLRSIARVEDTENPLDNAVAMKPERGKGFTLDSEASALIRAPKNAGRAPETVIIIRAGEAKQKAFD